MKDSGNVYQSFLEIDDVTVEDAGKYKLIAKNELGESNASISLNFDGKIAKAHSNVLAKRIACIDTNEF